MNGSNKLCKNCLSNLLVIFFPTIFFLISSFDLYAQTNSFNMKIPGDLPTGGTVAVDPVVPNVPRVFCFRITHITADKSDPENNRFNTDAALLRRCLEKEPDRRLRDIGDAALELEDALIEPVPSQEVEDGAALVILLFVKQFSLGGQQVVLRLASLDPVVRHNHVDHIIGATRRHVAFDAVRLAKAGRFHRMRLGVIG